MLEVGKFFSITKVIKEFQVQWTSKQEYFFTTSYWVYIYAAFSFELITRRQAATQQSSRTLTVWVNTFMLTSEAKNWHYHWFALVFPPSRQKKHKSNIFVVGLQKASRQPSKIALPAPSVAVRCKSCAAEFSNMKVTSSGNYPPPCQQ